MDALIQCLWSEAGWNEYISMFNALPDPLCPYYAHYNAESDEIEYNPVDKSGTSPVLLSTSRAVVPNLHEKRA
jgi:hypothetical protein